MKKTFRALAASLAALLCCTALSASGIALQIDQTSMPAQPNLETLRETDRNSYSVSLYQILTANLQAEACGTCNADTKTKAYPSYYGGAYIGLEDDRLHVQIVGENTAAAYQSITAAYTTMLESDARLDCFATGDVIFEPAKHSLQLLTEVQAALSEIMLDYQMCMVAIDDPNNGLEIGLKKGGSKEGILAFLTTHFPELDLDAVTFDENQEISFTASNTASNALAGAWAASSKGEIATLGLNVYNPSTRGYGVITAAHFATSGTTIYNAKGTKIGTATKRQCSGKLDAAFVPFPSGISPSNKMSGISGNDALTAYYGASTNVYGMNVNKIGYSSGNTEGVVMNSSTSIEVDGVIFNDQVKISNRQVAGDSGGPVYTTISGVNRLVGIATMADNTNNGFVSKASNFLSTFGLGFYNG